MSETTAPTSPRVSVVMSVYNGERHLAEAIDSILSQSMSDLELIVSDDGSIDGTSRILEEYGAKDERVRLVRNERNLGLTRSLNRGLSLAQGEYFARQDADDISLPERLAIQVRLLDANPHVGAIGTGFQRIDGGGTPLGQPTKVSADHEVIRASLLMMNPLPHSSLMARRTLVRELGGYDEELPYAQDYDLWWRIGRVASLHAVPDALVLSRRGERISTEHFEEQRRCSQEVSLRAVRESLGDRPLDEAAFRRFWWMLRGRHATLQAGDISRLNGLWSLLAELPAGPAVWRPRLRSVALRLLRLGYVRDGLLLLWIAMRLGLRRRGGRGSEHQTEVGGDVRSGATPTSGL